MAPFEQKRMLAHLAPGVGRPSEYRPEYCEMVIECMARGLSLSAFAGSIRVATDTVYRWQSQHREFSDAVSRAKAARIHNLEIGLLAANKGARVTARIFALKNAAPTEWKDVKYQEHQHMHEIRQISTAELRRIAAGEVGDLDADIIIEHEPQQANER